MSAIAVSQAKNEMKDLVNKVAYAKERICITSYGKPVAYMMPIEDVEALEAYEDEEDIRDADAAHKLYEKEGGIPSKQVWKELGV